MPAKRGRPDRYKKEYCSALVKHMAQGFSFDSFAATIDTSEDALREWRDKYTAFRTAFQKGKAKMRQRWETFALKALYQEKDTPKVFQTALWIFNMKNRFPNEWKDRQQIDVQGDGSGVIQLAYSIQPKEKKDNED